MTGDEQGMLFLWRMERAKVCALHHLSDILTQVKTYSGHLPPKFELMGKL